MVCKAEIWLTFVLIIVNLFQGYSYVAPSILFSENAITDALFQPSSDKRPSTTNILACRYKVFKYYVFLRVNLV